MAYFGIMKNKNYENLSQLNTKQFFLLIPAIIIALSYPLLHALFQKPITISNITTHPQKGLCEVCFDVQNVSNDTVKAKLFIVAKRTPWDIRSRATLVEDAGGKAVEIGMKPNSSNKVCETIAEFGADSVDVLVRKVIKVNENVNE